MANAKHSKGGKLKRNRPKCENYRHRGLREKHKATRIAKDKKRAKLMKCGHGSRYKHHIDGLCRKCYVSD